MDTQPEWNCEVAVFLTYNS